MQWVLLGMKFAPAIIGAINAIEKIVRIFKPKDGAPKTGEEKKAAALEFIASFIESAEGVAGRDLMNDAEVVDAVSKAIDAFVAVQNIVAKKAAAAATQPIP